MYGTRRISKYVGLPNSIKLFLVGYSNLQANDGCLVLSIEKAFTLKDNESRVGQLGVYFKIMFTEMLSKVYELKR